MAVVGDRFSPVNYATRILLSPGLPCVRSSKANPVVSRVPQEVGRLTDEKGGPPPFHRVFEAADRRGKGTLPPPAFRRCLLSGLGFELSEAECGTLLEYLVRGNLKQ